MENLTLALIPPRLKRRTKIDLWLLPIIHTLREETGAITRVIDRLEKAGYVQRARDLHDQHSVLIQLQPKMAEIDALIRYFCCKVPLRLPVLPACRGKVSKGKIEEDAKDRLPKQNQDDPLFSAPRRHTSAQETQERRSENQLFELIAERK